MKKFILRIAEGFIIKSVFCKHDGKFEELMNLERHFTSADVFVSGNLGESLLIERFGTRLTELKLTYRNVPPKALLKPLKYAPNLETLTMTHVCDYQCQNRFTNIIADRVVLNKLKKLVVIQDWTVIRLIVAPALVELETPAIDCSGNLNARSPQTLTSFENFLKNSTRLESLKVNIELFRRMSSKIPFKLKKITDHRVSSRYPRLQHYQPFN